MKLKELIERLDSPMQPYCGDELIEEFDHTAYYSLDEYGFTFRDITYWMCTDTSVGDCVIYHNNKPICITSQVARKSDTNFHWFSQEDYDNTKEFIDNLCKVDDDRKPNNILDLDIDAEDRYPDYGFKVDYISQLTRSHEKAIYKGEIYEINWNNKEFQQNVRSYIAPDMVPLKGLTDWIPLIDLRFPIALKK